MVNGSALPPRRRDLRRTSGEAKPQAERTSGDSTPALPRDPLWALRDTMAAGAAVQPTRPAQQQRPAPTYQAPAPSRPAVHPSPVAPAPGGSIADRFPRRTYPTVPAAPVLPAAPAASAAPVDPATPVAPGAGGGNERVVHRQVPLEHRRRWIAVTLIVVVVVIAAVTGGPWIYARVMADPAPGPLALSTPTQAPSNDPQVPLALDGTWQVAEPSQAGYRIGEVLTGNALEVVGRTDEVTGTVTIDGEVLTGVSVVVQAGTIATDESARDAFFRRALDTSTYPEATFTSTGPVDLTSLSTATEPVSVEVPGTVTLRDKTLDVVATVQLQRTEEGIEAVGAIGVPLSDLGLTAPDLGFVTVEDAGSIEFQLALTR